MACPGRSKKASCRVGGRREVTQIMYTHESKCKNDKIKLK
jgi:hypothetical protein